MKNFIVPALLGGIITFTLGRVSSMAGISYVGMLWPILGGMLAVVIFKRRTGENLVKAEGRLLGLIAGLFAGFFYFAWFAGSSAFIGLDGAMEMLLNPSSSDADSSSYSSTLSRFGAEEDMLSSILLGYYLVTTLLSALGGSLMARFSSKKKQEEPIGQTPLQPPALLQTPMPLAAIQGQQHQGVGGSVSLREVERKLEGMGIELPAPPQPLGAYVPCVMTGNLVVTSGFLPLKDGQLHYRGKVGRELDLEAGQAAARLAALNGLAALKEFIGDLDRITRVVKVTGYVASLPGFIDQAKVVNGASELLVEVFGDKGKHARMAIGAAELPAASPVAIELIVEIK